MTLKSRQIAISDENYILPKSFGKGDFFNDVFNDMLRILNNDRLILELVALISLSLIATTHH